MKILRKEALIVVFLLFSILPVASAQIILSQPKSLYNFGDKFELSMTIKPQTYVSGFLTTNLVCPIGQVELFRSPVSVNPGEEKKIDLEMNFDNFLVAGMDGQCHVEAIFMEDTYTTPKFEITKRISVTIDINAPVFDPGSNVLISGDAIKENQEMLNGFVEISVPDIEFKQTATVTGGKFNMSFRIPDNSPAGSYKIDVRAYEEDAFQDTINEGSTSNVLRINQVVKNIEIAYEKQSLQPIENLNYYIYLYDQSGEQATQDVSLTIYKPDETVFKKSIIRSNDQQVIQLEPNFDPGYWKVRAIFEELETEREFLIEEYKDLSFSLEGEYLNIENSGNVPYTGPVEIIIGDINEVRDLEELELGEIKQYKLEAPDGEWAIEAGKSALEKRDLGTTFLTGNAVSVDDVNDSFGSRMFIMVGLLLVLLGAIAFVLVYKKYKPTSLLLKSSSSDKAPVKLKGDEQKALEKGATQNLIDKGEKQETSILTLNLKNLPDLKENTEVLKTIDSALWKAKESGAKVYSDQDFRIAIFAPILTKEKDNTLRAASVAQSVERALSLFNKRSQTKIDYGIALHNGNLIVENNQGNFRFISLTNIIGGTKKIATQANSEILLTEQFHNKTLGKVKKSKIRDKNLWKLDRVVDRSEHLEYIKNLSLKNNQDSKNPN